MKTVRIILILVLLLALCNTNKAQFGHIDSIKMFPQRPTVNDSATFLIYMSFPSGMCNIKEHSTNFDFPAINHISRYCIGSFAYVCSDVDSVKIQKLSYGNYTFHYVSKSNYAYTGCPEFFPADSIDFSFSIYYPASVNDSQSIIDLFNFLIKFDTKKIIIKLTDSHRNAKLIIYSLLGRKEFQTTLFNKESEININLSDGLYLINVNCDGNSQTKKIFIKNNY